MHFHVILNKALNRSGVSFMSINFHQLASHFHSFGMKTNEPFFEMLEISQSLEKELDEFDRAKEQQDHVLEELVPKMNKEATKLTDVYSMDELIESDVLDSLKDDAINVLKANPDDLP